jgi:hypothetical protein
MHYFVDASQRCNIDTSFDAKGSFSLVKPAPSTGSASAPCLRPFTMGTMVRRFPFRLCVVVASFGLIFSSLAVSAQQNTSKRGRKYKTPPPTARIEVTVVRDSTGKPIENAAVIFHPMEGEKDKGNMELKTNEDGKTIIDVLPIGDTVRMQIIAKIDIRMKRPGEQYSIYKKHPETSEGGKSPGPAPAPASKDKPAAQPDAQPTQPQPK